MKSTAFLILLSLMGSATSGCRKAAHPVPDPSGNPRLIALAPNISEIVFAIGAGSNLVGRTSACDQPPEVHSVPVVGGYGEPSIERLLDLQPALVLYIDLMDKGLPNRLREHGVESRHIPCLRMDDIPIALEEVGNAAGMPERGAELAAALRAEIATARASVSNAPRPSVLTVIWANPLYTVGKGSFISELVELAGGRNLGDEMETPYFQASPEWVIDRDPDIILCLFEGKPDECVSRIANTAAFASLSAIKQGRVYSGFRLDEVMRPGPRVMRSVNALRQCFQQINPQEKP